MALRRGQQQQQQPPRSTGPVRTPYDGVRGKEREGGGARFHCCIPVSYGGKGSGAIRGKLALRPLRGRVADRSSGAACRCAAPRRTPPPPPPSDHRRRFVPETAREARRGGGGVRLPLPGPAPPRPPPLPRAVRSGGNPARLRSCSQTLEEHLERLARSVSPSDTNAAAAAASTAAGEMGEQKVCHSTTPCGWAVYVPFTRRVDYFMKNTCECPKDRECLRTDDDLSVSAYVYRCRAADKQDKQSES
ncbi:hypothetical protein ONE63_007619 [Megalurothrips usitatus]|uniref:Uncharacterized protein n=1 Tax=Megalurothrips usitatus TaxID=439358 RepID=A0AAV7XSC8_9NEOP|nr:hypothetical protein ONE63_007619 [Megalurothrips usitatus]